MTKKSYHVVRYSRGGWAVRKSGSEKASSTHKTQNEAIVSAINLAKKSKCSVFIHRANGQIRDVNNYA